MKKFDAAGTEGYLLFYGDHLYFRIYEYDENGKHKRDAKGHTIFKDYRILHHDLKIKLLDGCFYETETGGNFIDYPKLPKNHCEE